jgi:predicted nucleotidyltransferase
MDEHTNLRQSDGDAVDVFGIARLLVSKAVETYGDEIDIVGYYGSHARGTASATSDLDIFYIPADGTDPPVGRTFLVADILVDFWAIRWDTMAGFATGRVRGWSFAPAIVHHAKVLHARSGEQAARFAALKQQVLDLQRPEARPEMIRRALGEFRSVLADLGNLRLAIAGDDFGDVRHAGWKVILSAWECLALANQVFCDRGAGGIVDQIPELRARPPGLEALITTIGTSDDPTLIADAAERLAQGTREVLLECQKSVASERTVREVFDATYPEFRDGIRKALAACDRQQPFAAGVAAWSTQLDLVRMLYALTRGAGHGEFNLYSELACPYRQLGFADLLQPVAGNLSALAERARSLDRQLRRWLREQSIDLCDFGSVEEFERSV